MKCCTPYTSSWRERLTEDRKKCKDRYDNSLETCEDYDKFQNMCRNPRGVSSIAKLKILVDCRGDSQYHAHSSLVKCLYLMSERVHYLVAEV